MKVRDLIRILESDGWELVRIRGSHRQYKHFWKRKIVTISGHNNADLAIGTLKAILKAAELLEEE